MMRSSRTTCYAGGLTPGVTGTRSLSARPSRSRAILATTVAPRQARQRSRGADTPGGRQHDGHDRSAGDRRRPCPRPPDRPLRRRFRRRDAAHRRPVHLGECAVRQRPVHLARLPGRDPGPGRHRQRCVQLPGAHLRPRDHHAGRRAQRAGRDEPGGVEGRPAPARAAAARSSSTGRVRRTQPGEGRLRPQPAGRRLPVELPRAAGADDSRSPRRPPRRSA